MLGAYLVRVDQVMEDFLKVAGQSEEVLIERLAWLRMQAKTCLNVEVGSRSMRGVRLRAVRSRIRQASSCTTFPGNSGLLWANRRPGEYRESSF